MKGSYGRHRDFHASNVERKLRHQHTDVDHIGGKPATVAFPVERERPLAKRVPCPPLSVLKPGSHSRQDQRTHMARKHQTRHERTPRLISSVRATAVAKISPGVSTLGKPMIAA